MTYETTGGACAAPGTAGDTYQTGLAEQQTIIDSPGPRPRRHSVAPRRRDHGPAPRPHSFPTVVVSDGIASDQSDYFWLAMSLAREGDIVLTYDPAGQGAVRGQRGQPLYAADAGVRLRRRVPATSRTRVRWVVGDPITPSVDLSTSTPLGHDTGAGAANPDIHDPAYAPAGENVTDPALGLVDPSHLAVVGHSMGAISLLGLPVVPGQGADGADGRPLPPLAAGVALSGAAPTSAVVRIQFQTSDFDGSPTLIGPAVGGADLAFGTVGGIGYAPMKTLYDQLRTSGPAPSALS